MARLNIDYKQIRNSDEFKALVRILGGDEEKAFGRYIRFFDSAQDWYTGKRVGKKLTSPLRGGIPERIFALAGDLECMLEVGYATRRDDGVHAVDEGQFDWLLGKKKGGTARADADRNDDGTFAGGEDASRSPAGEDAGQQHQQPASSQPADAGSELVDSASSQPASSSLSLFNSTYVSPPLKVPLTPPAAKPPPRTSRDLRHEREDQAAAAATEAIKAGQVLLGRYGAGQPLQADDAGQALGELARELIVVIHGNWRGFCSKLFMAAYPSRRTRGTGETLALLDIPSQQRFEAQFRRDCRANLQRALERIRSRDGPGPQMPAQLPDETCDNAREEER